MLVGSYEIDKEQGIHILSGSILTGEGKRVIYGLTNPYSEEGMKRFKQFCLNRSIFFYARPREQFNRQEAITLAQKSGRTFLLMEDLS